MMIDVTIAAMSIAVAIVMVFLVLAVLTDNSF